LQSRACRKNIGGVSSSVKTHLQQIKETRKDIIGAIKEARDVILAKVYRG